MQHARRPHISAAVSQGCIWPRTPTTSNEASTAPAIPRMLITGNNPIPNATNPNKTQRNAAELHEIEQEPL